MIAAFRMYEVAPSAALAWRSLFERVLVEARVEAEIVEHRPPAPIAELWSRPDLACGFMCGWPFARGGFAMQPIAAPVPSPARYAGLPRYCSEFLVRADSPFTTLEHTFGHRFGWMARDSQSGFNAPLAHLAGYLGPGRTSLYAEMRGPLGAPAASLAALVEGAVDVIALDSFWLDLVRRHAPERVEGLRSLETTPWTPIPLLVAAREADAGAVERLAQVLCAAHRDPGLAPLLEPCLVARFVRPDTAAYGELRRGEDRARRLTELV
jgi:ABC-type phosphate/phosphonate transport system substrate-binding protein